MNLSREMPRCGPIMRPGAHPCVALARSEWRSIPWLRCWSIQHTDTFYLQAILHSLRISKPFLKGSRVMQDSYVKNSPNAVLT